MKRPVSLSEAIDQLRPEPGVVVLMCGLAGSGKTTVSKSLEAKGFLRLSFDEVLWSVCGRYGVDYPAEAYAEKQAIARAALMDQVSRGLAKRTPMVIDSAFWNRAARDGYRELAARFDCQCRVLHLKAEPALLRERLKVRAERFDANAAFPVTDEILDRFLKGFEAPEGEDEIVVAVE
ncbi:MAG: ATP-binding protein [Proteobacteria bacterium]|nr:ATP-binding protein [Pseudomonadota bacterium]